MPRGKVESNFIEITLRHGCSPVNLHIFRTRSSKNSSGRLLLKVGFRFSKFESDLLL